MCARVTACRYGRTAVPRLSRPLPRALYGSPFFRIDVLCVPLFDLIRFSILSEDWI